MRRLLFTLITLLSFAGAYAQQCNVSFSLSYSQTVPMQVTLNNTSAVSTVPGSTPVFYITWGDNTNGLVGLGGSVNHTYSNAGTFHVSMHLYYVDSLNNNNFICGGVDSGLAIINQPCMANISTANNGGGSYTFTANNIGGGTGLTYNWHFGDGTTGTGSPITHTYTSSGTYQVILVTTGSGCSHTSTTTVTYFNGTLNCAQLNASFLVFGNGYTKTFSNTSTPVNNIPNIKKSGSWDFGDGSAIVNNNNTPVHTYAAAGSYTVTLVNEWVDSSNMTVLCTDTSIQTITVTAPPPAPNVISGIVHWDSLNTNPFQASFKVWLIVMDPVQNTLTAVDSTIVSGWMSAPYSFSNHPAGTYRTKAAVLNGTSGAGTLVPTYHDTSFYWMNAHVINHTGGSSLNKNIHMISGVFAGGPGFIGGNISLGANKGTSGGVPNILVVLRNAMGEMVRFTYTDGNGNYSFGNIPTGTYTVFPEEMNYITIPSSMLTLASGQTFVGGVDFKQTPTHIKPIPAAVGDLAQSLFSVYPNPTMGNIDIKWMSGTTGTAQIQVVDMTGREVYSTSVQISESAKLDLSQLQTGIYFIKVATEKAQHSQKVQIQH